MAKIASFLIVIGLIILTPLFANGAYDQTQRGNKAFEQKLFGNAQAAYQEIVNKRSGRAEAHYNLGTALYKNKDYIDAEKEFLSAAEKTRKEDLAASCYYNAGNAALKLAQSPGKEKDVKEARERAIDHYRRALRINPEHINAAHNLEKLYQLSQQEQQNSQNQQQNSQNQKQQEDGESQDSGKQNQQSNGESSQDQQDSGQNAESDSQEQQDESQNNDNQNSTSENKDSESSLDNSGDEESNSLAEDLLDREEAQKEMRNQQQNNNLDVDRDW